MLSLKELVAYLDHYLNVSNVPDHYCPNGIQVEGKKSVKNIATAVSANLQTIEKAVQQQVDVLIVHHGMFWKNDSYRIEGAKQKKLKLLLENEISLLAYHLPLDAHREIGNNWKAAFDLGWQNLEGFGEFDGNLIGVKGSFPLIEIELFVAEVEAYYGHAATASLFGPKKIQSAALVSGGAYKALLEAAKEGVDCFITGNFDEPAWGVSYEEKIHFLALGHSATERIGPRTLAEHLKIQLGVATQFLDIANPF